VYLKELKAVRHDIIERPGIAMKRNDRPDHLLVQTAKAFLSETTQN